ncbi:MAG: hypothetical protein CMO66_04375 [Verrucomicrobiales bacterium]|nr:hypothetical protein [Verrucomicrobiales bacterium]
MAEPEVKNRKPRLLILIDSDPRTSPRPAEALRVAGGIGVWEQVQVSVVLRHAASWAYSADAEGLKGGRMFRQFIGMVRESGGEVYLQASEETMQVIDAETLMQSNLKDSRLAELAAGADYLMRF